VEEKVKIIEEVKKIMYNEGIGSAIDAIKNLIKLCKYEHLRWWLRLLLDCLSDLKNKIFEEVERENFSDKERKELVRLALQEEEINRGWYCVLSGDPRNVIAQSFYDAIDSAVEILLENGLRM
jgi:hypothetical protein